MAPRVLVLEHRDEDRPAARRSNVVISERTIREVDPEDWNRFVLACDGSFLSAWRVVWTRALVSRVRIFDFHLASGDAAPEKIAQCAVEIGRGQVSFIDRLHVVPARHDDWAACVQQVIEQCGAATYHYGSPWNHEARPSIGASGALVAAKVQDTRFQLDRIDFANWAGFAAYRRSVSENIRRDYKKAAAAAARVEVRHGLAAWRDLFALVGLRRQVMRRNGEPFWSALDLWRHALKLVCLGPHAFIAKVKTPRGCHAALFGVQFGDNLYYISGGTEDRCQGFGSFLFLTLLERWFAASPRGKLYMGLQVACVDPATYTRGNLLYRRKLRVTSVDGAQFSIQVSPPLAEPGAGGRVRRPSEFQPFSGAPGD